MIKEYFEEAKLNITPLQKINIHLNNKFSKQILKGVKVINFENMYPTIFKQMFDNGYLPESEEPYIKKIESWLTRKQTGLDKKLSPQQCQDLRFFKNAYYGNLYKRNPEYCNLLVEYINVFYSKINEDKKFYEENLIYYDTDSIFLKDEEPIIDYLNELNIPYEINDVNYLYIEGLKRFIFTNKLGGVEVKGIRSNKKTNRYKNALKSNSELMENIIRREIRNDKLNKILI